MIVPPVQQGWRSSSAAVPRRSAGTLARRRHLKPCTPQSQVAPSWWPPTGDRRDERVSGDGNALQLSRVVAGSTKLSSTLGRSPGQAPSVSVVKFSSDFLAGDTRCAWYIYSLQKGRETLRCVRTIPVDLPESQPEGSFRRLALPSTEAWRSGAHISDDPTSSLDRAIKSGR